MANDRFIRPGVTKYFFLPAVAAATLIPTRAEVTAGTDLSKHIADVNGWMLQNQNVETPDMASKFTSKIPGKDEAPDSSFTFYEYKDVATIETLLPKETAGFVVIMRKGDVPASLSMDIFPVRVGSLAPEHDAGNTPARQVCNFAITDVPALNKAVPAAV
jgi:hypothetical protein